MSSIYYAPNDDMQPAACVKRFVWFLEPEEQNTGEENVNESDKQEKSNRLPISKIRMIMKTDPDVNICSSDASLAICRLAVSSHFS